MKLYLLSQSYRSGYDTYDSCVVCAESEDEAKYIHPSRFVTHYRGEKWYGTYSNNSGEYETENDEYGSWVTIPNLDKLEIKYLGEATEGLDKGVILSSFNAG